MVSAAISGVYMVFIAAIERPTNEPSASNDSKVRLYPSIVWSESLVVLYSHVVL